MSRVKIPQHLQVIESYLARPNAPHTMLEQIFELGDAAFDHVCARLDDLPPDKADRAEWLLLELGERVCRERRPWLVQHGCQLLMSDAEWRRGCGARAVWRFGRRLAGATPLREVTAWSEPVRTAVARGLALGVPPPWDAHVRDMLDPDGAYWYPGIRDPMHLHVFAPATGWAHESRASAARVRVAFAELTPGTAMVVAGDDPRALVVAGAHSPSDLSTSDAAVRYAVWRYDGQRVGIATSSGESLLDRSLATEVVDAHATYRRLSDRVDWPVVAKLQLNLGDDLAASAQAAVTEWLRTTAAADPSER